jgi:predicted RNA-binding Zn-ribbon protein involved in translation (DUF1610 family)
MADFENPYSYPEAAQPPAPHVAPAAADTQLQAVNAQSIDPSQATQTTVVEYQAAAVPPAPTARRKADEEEAIDCLEKLRGLPSGQTPAENSKAHDLLMLQQHFTASLTAAAAVPRYDQAEVDPRAFEQAHQAQQIHSPATATGHSPTHAPDTIVIQKHQAEFVCDTCHKGCRTKHALYVHTARKHKSTAERDFPCHYDGCNKHYPLKDSLTKHIQRKHKTPTRLVCGMTGPDGAFCEKSFLTERERNDHFARRHPQQLAPILASPAGVTGPDGNPIPNPDGTAPDATILIKPKFGCPHCPQVYTTRNSLNLHVSRNHAEPKYKCRYCGEAYSVRGDLNQHERRKHKISNKDEPAQAPGTPTSFTVNPAFTDIGAQFLVQGPEFGQQDLEAALNQAKQMAPGPVNAAQAFGSPQMLASSPLTQQLQIQQLAAAQAAAQPQLQGSAGVGMEAPNGEPTKDPPTDMEVSRPSRRGKADEAS